MYELMMVVVGVVAGVAAATYMRRRAVPEAAAPHVPTPVAVEAPSVPEPEATPIN